MTEFKSVAVVGGTGDLGHVLVRSLAATGDFDIRIVSRKKTVEDLSTSNVSTITADYESLDSLCRAFNGCDVVVNALGDRVLTGHRLVLKAAIAARVKRYVPSQWGTTPRVQDLLNLPFIKAKFDNTDLVEKAANDGQITFTSFAGGPWVEYVMEFPTMMSVPHRSFFMHEDPDFEFSLSSRSMFAEALISALRKPQETMNRHLHIELVRLSQNRALQLAQEVLSGEHIKVDQTSHTARYERGLARLPAGVADRFVFADVLSKLIFDPKTNLLPAQFDNGLLELRKLTEKETRAVLKEISISQRYSM